MNILWTEAHRPTSLDQLALLEGNRTLLQKFIDEGEIPHLLLHGPPGTGKTTVAQILISQLDCAVLKLNASSERGIDVIRDRVSTFARSLLQRRWNIVFLDEADKLTPDSQTALRNTMEAHAGRTRFILTGNLLHKIIDPLRSRCQVLEFAQMPLKERFRVLKDVLVAEEVEFDPNALLELAGKYNDMRKLLMAAQRIAIQDGGLQVIPEEQVRSGAAVLAMCTVKDWTGIVQLSKTPGFDHAHVLTEMFWAVEGEDEPAIMQRLKLAQAVDKTGYTPDPVILFLGTCAEIISSV